MTWFVPVASTNVARIEANENVGANHVTRAFSVHPDAGAFASIAMGLHGIAGAILIPPLLPWLRGLLV